jgi:hypothetical protein
MLLFVAAALLVVLQQFVAAVSMPQHAAAPTDHHLALTIIASASLAT